MASSKLYVPCCYQGGKQRVAAQIVDIMLAHCDDQIKAPHFYDLCCGSGAVTIELINRGIQPSQITMLDASSWGSFWNAIGTGSFSADKFKKYLDLIPANKADIKTYMTELASKPVSDDEPYIYLILQACSFGGKQIWLRNGRWKNAFFRSYWEPTATSIRRSPANPMQPSPSTLYRRVETIIERCKGITCLKGDIMEMADTPLPMDSIIYVDPPYEGTTSYGFSFDLQNFIERRKTADSCPLFVSEGHPLGNNSIELIFGGAKGGISGNKPRKHREWLTLF